MLEPIEPQLLHHGQLVIFMSNNIWTSDEITLAPIQFSRMVTLKYNGATFDLKFYPDNPITRTHLLLKKIKIKENYND